MFLLYLNPLPVKAHLWLYSWIRCAAINRLSPGDVGFIGAPWQLVPPSEGQYPDWVLYEIGTISDGGWEIGTISDRGWNKALKIEVPAQLCEQIADAHETPLDLLRTQALEGFQIYRDWLFEKLSSLQ